MDWYFGDAKELYEILVEANIPVMVMEPVHGGLLANLTEDAATVLRKMTPEKEATEKLSFFSNFYMPKQKIET